MSKDADALGVDFERWKQLTDDYEAALEALAREEPGARDRAMQLSLALRHLLPPALRPNNGD